MQFGNVYDEDGKLIDAISVHKKGFMNPKTKVVEIIETDKVEPVIIEVNPINPLPEVIRTEVVIEEEALKEIKEAIETVTPVDLSTIEKTISEVRRSFMR